MNQAIELLSQYLLSKGLVRRNQLLRDAEAAPDRIISFAGDDALEGVSVTFAGVRRATLLIEDTGEAAVPYVRAEGNVEAITLAAPPVPSSWPETVDVTAIPGVAPLYYAQLTPAEVAALPGADQFIPALHNAMVAKTIVALTPPPEPPPVVVPDVVGLVQAAAETAITGAGLGVGSVTMANDAVVPAGNVISQDPAAGSSVPATSPVNLVVSLGPVG